MVWLVLSIDIVFGVNEVQVIELPPLLILLILISWSPVLLTTISPIPEIVTLSKEVLRSCCLYNSIFAPTVWFWLSFAFVTQQLRLVKSVETVGFHPLDVYSNSAYVLGGTGTLLNVALAPLAHTATWVPLLGGFIVATALQIYL